MPIASVTRSVKYAQKGAPGKSGRIPYPAGEYNLYTSYICTDTVTPYVLDGKYYVMNRNTTWVGQGMPSNINSPQKDVAVNGSKATWTLVEDYTAIFVEILMANFAKLASAIFSGDYMFSQQGLTLMVIRHRIMRNLIRGILYLICFWILPRAYSKGIK